MAMIALVLFGALVQSSSWTDVDRKAAVAIAEQKGDEWRSCLAGALNRYKARPEEPSIIASASFGACEASEIVYRKALATSFRGLLEPSARDDEADQIIATARHRFTDFAAAEVLDARMQSKR